MLDETIEILLEVGGAGETISLRVPLHGTFRDLIVSGLEKKVTFA